MAEQGVESCGIVGTCWGGLVTMTLASQADKYKCAVSIHGARLTPELMELVTMPVAIMPGCGDGDFLPLMEVLDKKEEIKDKCFYRKYGSGHGFTVSRGDWTQQRCYMDALDAINNAAMMMDENL